MGFEMDTQARQHMHQIFFDRIFYQLEIICPDEP